MENKNTIISFNNVGKIYRPMNEVALTSVNFEVNTGDFICMVGPSGGGKTTILKIIAGLEKETSGTVIKPENVSMVFQSVALFPWLSIYENIRMVLTARNMPEHEIKKTVMKYIDVLKLSEFKDKLPSELSGGQRQRVGIARALSVDPDVLLLDEPFSALDAKTTSELHHDLISIWKETGKTIVMVSHLIEETVSLATKILLVKNKKIEAEFPITLSYPRREQAHEFMNEVTKIRTEFFK